MQNEHIVAIWLGEFASRDELFDYTDFFYEENEAGFSQFAHDIGVEWYDEDFFEAEFHGEGPDFGLAIQEYSWYKYYKSPALLSISRLNTKSRGTSLIILFGQKTDMKEENEFLWDYEGQVAEGAPISFVGKFPIELPFE
ncbi:MAG: immunity 22 family protein [Bacteroidia bacterium]|nr:immunity 22 family protein [Bacteroidia bacterium]